MNLKFWEKKQPSKIEKLYEQTMMLQIRQSRFEKQYFDIAWKLEKQRHNGKEYVS
jgi:hypothetical protein